MTIYDWLVGPDTTGKTIETVVDGLKWKHVKTHPDGTRVLTLTGTSGIPGTGRSLFLHKDRLPAQAGVMGYPGSTKIRVK